LSEYVDHNKDVLLFGRAIEPIQEDKTWCLVDENTNRIKPYGGAADLKSVLERLKLLQAGTVVLQETNRDIVMNFKKNIKAFGAARVECSTTKDKCKTSPFKPGGLQVQSWVK
jgi:hypothetical protein